MWIMQGSIKVAKGAWSHRESGNTGKLGQHGARAILGLLNKE